MHKPLFDDTDEASDKEKEKPDEEVKELMENHDLDEDEAEEVKEPMDETGRRIRRSRIKRCFIKICENIFYF